MCNILVHRHSREVLGSKVTKVFRGHCATQLSYVIRRIHHDIHNCGRLCVRPGWAFAQGLWSIVGCAYIATYRGDYNRKKGQPNMVLILILIAAARLSMVVRKG